MEVHPRAADGQRPHGRPDRRHLRLTSHTRLTAPITAAFLAGIAHSNGSTHMLLPFFLYRNVHG